jgi:hypothetical protein
MAHVFTRPQNVRWVGEDETAANFLHSYAMEKGGFRYGTLTDPNSDLRFVKTAGTQHRHRRLQVAVDSFKNNQMLPFSYGSDNAYNLYMLGLVEGLGWNTMKKAVQSYQNGTYKRRCRTMILYELFLWNAFRHSER